MSLEFKLRYLVPLKGWAEFSDDFIEAELNGKIEQEKHEWLSIVVPTYHILSIVAFGYALVYSLPLIVEASNATKEYLKHVPVFDHMFNPKNRLKYY